MKTILRFLQYFTNNIYLCVLLKVDNLSFLLDKAVPREEGIKKFLIFMFQDWGMSIMEHDSEVARTPFTSDGKSKVLPCKCSK